MSVPSPPDNAPPVIGLAYDLLLWLIPKVEHLPRAYRFTVGERLVTHGLDLLTAPVEARSRQEVAAPVGQPEGQ